MGCVSVSGQCVWADKKRNLMEYGERGQMTERATQGEIIEYPQPKNEFEKEINKLNKRQSPENYRVELLNSNNLGSVSVNVGNEEKPKLKLYSIKKK